MTVLAARTKYPFAKVNEYGASVSGRVIEFREVQETFENKPLTFKNGDPIMGLNVTLEQVPGDEDSRVILGVAGKNMKDALSDAIAAVDGTDIEEGADLSVLCTGKNGRAWTYTATYALPFDPTV